jgi:hypothetical protein
MQFSVITMDHFLNVFNLFIQVFYSKKKFPLHKDIEWKEDWFSKNKKVPLNYWKSIENRKNFLEEMKTKFGIKQASDWGNISNLQICKSGGSGLLSLYKGSFFACLQSTYVGK